MNSYQMTQSQNLSEINQNIQIENRRLRERLLELYVQINSLTSFSEDIGISTTLQETSKYRRLSNAAPYRFVQQESMILPGGAIYSASLNPKEDVFALASLSGAITVMSTDLKTSCVLSGHSLSCRDVYWSEIGLISCGFDRKVKLWDVQEGKTSREFETNGLAHSVCGMKNDVNSIFAASGDKIYWIDTRRKTPITVSSESQTTAVTCWNDYIIYGGYDGYLNIMDRRNIQGGKISGIDLGGGPISSFSRVLDSGRFIASTVKAPHQLIQIGDEIKRTSMPCDAPGRFGCRGAINDKSLIFEGDYEAVCGGKMGIFFEGNSGNIPQILEDVNGFIYGALFITNLSHKILTYSEDGALSVWSLRQF